MTELVVNGTFSFGLDPWVVTGALSHQVVGGKLEVVVPGGVALTDVTVSQAFALPGAGFYSTSWRASATVDHTIRADLSTVVRSVTVTPTEQGFSFLGGTAGPAPDSVLVFNLGGAAEDYTFTLDNVSTIYTANSANFWTDDPATVADPVMLNVNQLDAGNRVTITRTVDGVETTVGVFTADAGGEIHYPDYLYPFGASVLYTVYDGSSSVIMATETVQTPDASVPWLRDTFVPELLNAPTAIVDITGRARGGRVTVYRVVGEKYPVTLGDIRQASEGTMTVLCQSHADRDRVIATLSSGYPCSLRVPSACRTVVDDMLFTPLDITETRFGTNGACTLDIDFVEVLTSDLPQYVAISYATQTANATTNDILYQELASRFAGLNYGALYLSPDGINPS